MPRFASVLLVGLLGSMPMLAFSQNPTQTLWLCGLSGDALRLVCMADAATQVAYLSAEKPVAVVNGTRFPLDPRQQYTVELLTQATEMEFVEQLARATMCYRTPSCSVAFTPPRSDVAQVSPR